MKRTVTRVDQSPLNPKRWCLTLDCGHELWLTSVKKPKGKTIVCEQAHDDEGPAFTAKLQAAGVLSSEPIKAKPAGSSPALRIPCKECGAPAGSYCVKGHGKIQVISHKRRREEEAATRPSP